MSHFHPKSILIILFALASLVSTSCTPTEESASSEPTPAKTVEVIENLPETKPKKKEKPAPYQPAPGYKFKGSDPFKK